MKHIISTCITETSKIKYITETFKIAAHSRAGPAPIGPGYPFTGLLLGAELQPTLALGPSRISHVLSEVCLPSLSPLLAASRSLGPPLPPVAPSLNNSDARNHPSVQLRLPLAAVARPNSGPHLHGRRGRSTGRLTPSSADSGADCLPTP